MNVFLQTLSPTAGTFNQFLTTDSMKNDHDGVKDILRHFGHLNRKQ